MVIFENSYLKTDKSQMAEWNTLKSSEKHTIVYQHDLKLYGRVVGLKFECKMIRIV